MYDERTTYTDDVDKKTEYMLKNIVKKYMYRPGLFRYMKLHLDYSNQMRASENINMLNDEIKNKGYEIVQINDEEYRSCKLIIITSNDSTYCLCDKITDWLYGFEQYENIL